MFAAAERAALEAVRVGRLATADAAGRPHVVPVCYALATWDDGPVRLVTPIDEKPKTAGPAELRRIRDIRANPRVAVVVDRYTEDWNRLWWVQVRGTAVVLEPGAVGHAAAVTALRDRYDQYASHDLEARPVIAVTPGSVRSWGELEAVSQ
jgi:PPOX class probable F420-dependent enzyme